MSTLYTGKGDGGTTKFFGPDASGRGSDPNKASELRQHRVSKASPIAEALGNLDELNSFLGLVKIKAGEFSKTIENIQENIFIISARIAGADKNITEEKVKEIEAIIAECEKELPLITKFSIAGGTELSAHLDFARTLARRAERRVVAVHDELGTISPEVLKYPNRLSSILFALARLTNLKSGIKESAPSYN